MRHSRSGRDARLFHFKEPRAFDVPVTLLVFLKELPQNESTTGLHGGGGGVAPALLLTAVGPKVPAGMDNCTLV